MKVLGIETSCDETAAAVVEDGKRLLSNVVASSMDLHIEYGGVVPEIAARSHIESILPVIHQALYDAKYGQGSSSSGVQGADEQQTEPYTKYGEGAAQFATPQSAESGGGATRSAGWQAATAADLWDDIDAIAVTYGAGLGGSLLVGVLTARTLAIALNKPLYAINHVEAHLYVNFLTESALPDLVLRETQPAFPMLGIIVSGGHSQFALFEDHFKYRLLGQTRDDAIGEAYDKVAKILGLPYPGGPSVGKKAAEGNPTKYPLPVARLENMYDFSFSGLKTAVLRRSQSITGHDHTFPSSKLPEALSEAQKADIAASFAHTAVKTIVDKAKSAYEEFQPASIVIGGGVAADPELRRQLSEAIPLPIDYSDRKLCTDNGAMVATLGCYKAMLGQPEADPYTLDIAPNLSM